MAFDYAAAVRQGKLARMRAALDRMRIGAERKEQFMKAAETCSDEGLDRAGGWLDIAEQIAQMILMKRRDEIRLELGTKA